VGPLITAALFLLQIIFAVVTGIFLVRLLIQYFRGNFFSSIGQFILKFTNPVVNPLKGLPTLKGVSLAIVLVVFALTLLKLMVFSAISFGGLPAAVSIVFWVVGDVVRQVINVFFYAILLQVIFSWVTPPGGNPIADILFVLTEPLLKPARRLIPAIAGFDLSPIAVLIGLQVLNIVLVGPLMRL